MTLKQLLKIVILVIELTDIYFIKFRKEKIMEIKDFKEQIDNKNFDSVYKQIVNKTIELAEKIATKKDINIERKEGIEEKLYKIIEAYDEQSKSFQSVPYLVENLLNWDVKEDYDETELEKLTRYINLYNEIIVELERYEKIEKEIQKIGYETLENEKIKKLIQLFKEMMEYKNKEYNKNWNFNEWIRNIDKHYHFYHYILINTLNQIETNTIYREIEIDYNKCIKTNNVENILSLDNLYNTLNNKQNGYKYYANFYREIELKPGQTYSDIYNLEKEKFIKLYKEMLDFVNVKYENNDFNKLETLVIENYPYYEDSIRYLRASMFDSEETDIVRINDIENTYENLSKDYKNLEQNMKEYQEELDEDIGFYDDEII